MTQPRFRLLGTATALLAGSYAFIAFTEGVYIGNVATPAQIADYHFGSEAMLSHGGSAYASAAAYVRAQWFQGFVALGVALAGSYLASAATRQDGRLVDTWALRLPAYAWLISGLLTVAIAGLALVSPDLILTQGDSPVEGPRTFGQAAFWLPCGIVSLVVGMRLWQKYARSLRTAG